MTTAPAPATVARMEACRLVLLDRYPHPEFREYRVCRVTTAPDGTVTAWEPETLVAGGTQEDAHAACLAMAGAFYLPVLRESELPDGLVNRGQGDGQEA